MSNKYKFRDNEKLYFVSFSVVYWIDVFIRRDYKDILIESLKHCISEKGLEIYGYCIMTSHIHLIIGSAGKRMENIMRDLKSYTSRKVKEIIKENSQESR